MYRLHALTILSVLLSASSVWAQKNAVAEEASCVVMPIFHCIQHLQDGSAIGHFGYDLQCADDTGATAETYIDINDNNRFSPGPKDRGQPKIFLSGKHIDEFEADFSLAEVKGSSVYRWSVKGKDAVVYFAKTKDEFLNCSLLSQ